MTNTKPYHQTQFERETETAKKLDALYNYLVSLQSQIQSFRENRESADYVKISPDSEYGPIVRNGEYITDPNGDGGDGNFYFEIAIFTDGANEIPGLKTEIERANREYIRHINGFIYDQFYNVID